MVAISAEMVRQLRQRTGQGMMDCKNALTETHGDMEKAVDVLRKKGLAVMEKRGDRTTKEGKIIGKISPDGKKAVLVTLCSETDFAAKSDAFEQAALVLADSLLGATHLPESPDAIADLEVEPGRNAHDVINEIVSKTGEKITVGPFCRFELNGPGLLHHYVHFNGKIATLLQIEAETQEAADCDAVKTLSSDLAMQVTAANPVAVSRDKVDPELIAREKEVASAQVANKPPNIIDKIVTGKLNKWFQQIVLLEQPFVKDDSQTVSQLLDEVSRKVGAKISVCRFTRLQIG